MAERLSALERINKQTPAHIIVERVRHAVTNDPTPVSVRTVLFGRRRNPEVIRFLCNVLAQQGSPVDVEAVLKLTQKQLNSSEILLAGFERAWRSIPPLTRTELEAIRVRREAISTRVAAVGPAEALGKAPQGWDVIDTSVEGTIKQAGVIVHEAAVQNTLALIAKAQREVATR